MKIENVLNQAVVPAVKNKLFSIKMDENKKIYPLLRIDLIGYSFRGKG